MKICIPVNENKGMESTVYNHFGSAPLFLIYDSEKEDVKVLENKDLHHEHGKCQPLKAISGESVDAVIVGGIGMGAISRLNSEGIKVYKMGADTLLKNIELFNSGKLAEFSTSNCCDHHGCKH